MTVKQMQLFIDMKSVELYFIFVVPLVARIKHVLHLHFKRENQMM